ncbi:unnamed protein product, partial [Amoebophrya sp. A120]|eukprot:GSA120T00015293001.1
MAKKVPPNFRLAEALSKTAVLFQGQKFLDWPNVLCEFSHRVTPDLFPVEVVPTYVMSDTELTCIVPEAFHGLDDRQLQVRLAQPQTFSTVWYAEFLVNRVNLTLTGDVVSGSDDQATTPAVISGELSAGNSTFGPSGLSWCGSNRTKSLLQRLQNLERCNNGTDDGGDGVTARMVLLRQLFVSSNSSTVVLNDSNTSANASTTAGFDGEDDANDTNASNHSAILAGNGVASAVAQGLGVGFTNQSLVLVGPLNRSICEIQYVDPILPFVAPLPTSVRATTGERSVFLSDPVIERVHPRYGFDAGGNIISVFGQNLPALLQDPQGRTAVRCDFGKAGVTFA